MQKRLTIADLSAWWRRVGPWLLALSWFAGVAFGTAAGCSSTEFSVPLIRESVQCDMSISGMLSTTLLPFLLSALAVSFSEPWLLLVISTFKAFSFSFCAWGVCLAFGQSSWLVLFLFLFSDFCLIPLLYLYWLRHIKGLNRIRRWELAAFLTAAITVGCIDYLYIAPFLVSLF